MAITRRDFLKGTTAAAVSAGISSYGLGMTTLARAQNQKADKDYVIKLGYYNCDHMTAAPVAKDAGIFEELGLKVEVVGNAKVPEAMAAGQMDVGYIGFERVVRANLKGCPIFISAMNHLGGSYYFVVRNDLYELYRNDPKVLLGKKLSLGTEPEKNQAEWVTFARKVGLPPEGKHYETFNMTDKDEFLALKTGSLDGFMTCDPWGSYAEFDKCGRIVPEFTITRMPSGKWGTCCVLAMNKNFSDAHPDLAKKMILAHSRSLQFIYTRPAKTAEIFARNYSVPLEVAFMTIFKKTVEEDRTMRWDIYPENIQEALNWNLGTQTLDQAAQKMDYLQTELLARAGTDDFNKFIKEKVDPIFPLGMTYEDWKKKAYTIEKQSA